MCLLEGHFQGQFLLIYLFFPSGSYFPFVVYACVHVYCDFFFVVTEKWTFDSNNVAIKNQILLLSPRLRYVLSFLFVVYYLCAQNQPT